MRVNTHTGSNTLQRGRSCFYCLWEFTQQQLMAFHFSFYRAIKWHVSSLPSYFHPAVIVRGGFVIYICHTKTVEPDSKLPFASPKICLLLSVFSNVFFCFFLNNCIISPSTFTPSSTVHQMVYCCEIEHLHLQYLRQCIRWY